jgi:hypothetical protein
MARQFPLLASLAVHHQMAFFSSSVAALGGSICSAKPGQRHLKARAEEFKAWFAALSRRRKYLDLNGLLGCYRSVRDGRCWLACSHPVVIGGRRTPRRRRDIEFGRPRKPARKASLGDTDWPCDIPRASVLSSVWTLSHLALTQTKPLGFHVVPLMRPADCRRQLFLSPFQHARDD